MHKKILVPLDGSKKAEEVIEYLEQLGSVDEIEVLLLRVVEPAHHAVGAALARPIPYLIPQDTHNFLIDGEEQMRVQQAQSYLSRIASVLSERGFAGVSTLVDVGRAASRIVSVAEYNGADLVLVYDRGRSTLSRALSGSVLPKVLRNSRVPVLVAKSVFARSRAA